MVGVVVLVGVKIEEATLAAAASTGGSAIVADAVSVALAVAVAAAALVDKYVVATRLACRNSRPSSTCSPMLSSCAAGSTGGPAARIRCSVIGYASNTLNIVSVGTPPACEEGADERTAETLTTRY